MERSKALGLMSSGTLKKRPSIYIGPLHGVYKNPGLRAAIGDI